VFPHCFSKIKVFPTLTLKWCQEPHCRDECVKVAELLVRRGTPDPKTVGKLPLCLSPVSFIERKDPLCLQCCLTCFFHPSFEKLVQNRWSTCDRFWYFVNLPEYSVAYLRHPLHFRKILFSWNPKSSVLKKDPAPEGYETTFQENKLFLKWRGKKKNDTVVYPKLVCFSWKQFTTGELPKCKVTEHQKNVFSFHFLKNYF